MSAELRRKSQGLCFNISPPVDLMLSHRMKSFDFPMIRLESWPRYVTVTRRHDLPVGKGQFVYLRNHPKGRNKIQDAWDLAMYKVEDVPGPEGAVYTVTPAHGDGPTKRVHRTLMRPCQKMVQPCPDINPVEQSDPPNTRSRSKNRAVDPADEDADFIMLRRHPLPHSNCCRTSRTL